MATGGIKNLAAKTAGVTARHVEPQQDKDPRSAPVQIYDITTRMHDAEQRAKDLEEALAAALEKAKSIGSIDLDRSLIVRVPGRQRVLSSDQRAELKANLEQHPLATPVTVLALADEKFELLAGYNREEIYGELGRPTIKAWVLQGVETERVEELAFFSNLLHPDLTPYEKYVGLRNILDSNPDVKTIEQLAIYTGMARATVGLLMHFSDLPKEVMNIIGKSPASIGLKTIQYLAQAVQAGRTEQVIEAVQYAVDTEKVEQQEIVQRVNSLKAGKARAAPTRPTPKTFQSGKRRFCAMVVSKKVLRIDVNNEEDMAEVEAGVERILAEIAKRKKQ